jgi:hypothetical protein
MQEVERYATNNPKKVLIATKIDVEDSTEFKADFLDFVGRVIPLFILLSLSSLHLLIPVLPFTLSPPSLPSPSLPLSPPSQSPFPVSLSPQDYTYFEVSSKTGENVIDTFIHLAVLAFSWHNALNEGNNFLLKKVPKTSGSFFPYMSLTLDLDHFLFFNLSSRLDSYLLSFHLLPFPPPPPSSLLPPPSFAHVAFSCYPKLLLTFPRRA